MIRECKKYFGNGGYALVMADNRTNNSNNSNSKTGSSKAGSGRYSAEASKLLNKWGAAYDKNSNNDPNNKSKNSAPSANKAAGKNKKVLTKEQFIRRKKIKRFLKRNKFRLLAYVTGLILICAIIVTVVSKVSSRTASASIIDKVNEYDVSLKTNLGVESYLLSPSANARPLNPLKQVKRIVLHYTSQSGKSAIDIRNQYEDYANTGSLTHDSCHFIIGLSGEIIQAIPTDECALASGAANIDSISITMCNELPSGEPTDSTYSSLVRLVTELCNHYNLGIQDVVRHYDIDGSSVCPRYFVINDVPWQMFLQDIQNGLTSNEKN